MTYVGDPVLLIQERSDRDDRELIFDVGTDLIQVMLEGDGHRGAEHKDFMERRFRSGEAEFAS